MSNGAGDIATQIKALFNRRYDLIKEKKKKRIILIIAVVAFLIAIVFGVRALILKSLNDKKDLELAELQQTLENQKVQIKNQITEIEEAKSKATDDVLERLEQAELIAQNNLYLVEQNIKLQNQIKEAAKAGVKPQNYGKTEEVTEAVDYSKLEYIGEFEGTAYTPSVQECGNNLGYTASRKAYNCWSFNSC